MTYDPGIPQPFDIPRESQDGLLSDFNLLNSFFNVDHVPYAGVITAISQSNPCRVTSPTHTLLTGDQVTFYNLDEDTGMENLNGNTYTITVIDQNIFSLNGVDSSGFPAYDAELKGGNYDSVQLNHGFHKRVAFAANLPKDPNLIGYTNLYPKLTHNKSNLFFQNGILSTSVKQLVGFEQFNAPVQRLGNEQANVHQGSGIRTPWGLIINFGWLQSFDFPLITFDFAIPFTSNVYTLIGGAIQTNNQAAIKMVGNVVSLTQFQMANFVSAGQLNAFQHNYYIAIGR